MVMSQVRWLVMVAIAVPAGLAVACGADSTGAIRPPYPNEPQGSQVLVDWDFDIANAGNPPFYYTSGIPPATTTADNSAPVNQARIGRVQFDPSLQAGTGPSTLASALLPPATWRTWYHSFWFKTSPNYRNEMAFPGLKIWDMLTANPNGSLIVQLYGVTSFTMLFSYRWTEASDHYGAIALERNRWYQIEILATDLGGGAARYQLFVDGIEDINVVKPRASNADFVYGWIMGGGPGTITVTSFIYHDHMRFSYTN